VVLAYSGGLDTSVAVRWMIENPGSRSSACRPTSGRRHPRRQPGEGARRRLAYEELDLREEFARDYLAPVIKANALRGQYPLVSALSRPLIVKHQVDIARRFGADGIAHGCTGKGNDQVRFEVSTMALAPDLELVAPVRNWGFTREDSIAYAAQHNIPIRATKEKMYSIDDNLWGRAIECGEMEDPWAEPPSGVWELTKPTATERREVVIGSSGCAGLGRRRPDAAARDRGAPQRRGRRLRWGRLDMVENRRVGIKSRETYEAPGGLALMLAHADLESITVDATWAARR
jgi:argininosuccinate synthase